MFLDKSLDLGFLIYKLGGWPSGVLRLLIALSFLNNMKNGRLKPVGIIRWEYMYKYV